MLPGQSKIDVFSDIRNLMGEPYELCIFNATITELNKIASSKKKDNINAKIALELIKQKNLKTLKSSSNEETTYIDDIILNNIDNSYILCTQDKALKRLVKAKNKKIRIITVKSRNNLGFE
jgi:rRNA-processing protein FCF1